MVGASATRRPPCRQSRMAARNSATLRTIGRGGWVMGRADLAGRLTTVQKASELALTRLAGGCSRGDAAPRRLILAALAFVLIGEGLACGSSWLVTRRAGRASPRSPCTWPWP